MYIMNTIQKRFLLIAILLFVSVGVFAQKSEATVTFEMTSQDSTAQAMFEMMGGFKIIMMYKDNRVRLDMNMMGSTIKTVMDNKKEQGLMLLDIMGAKKAYFLDKDYIEKEKAKEVPSNKVTLTKETKKIAGYKCKKALVSNENQKLVIYYTDKIQPLVTMGDYSYEGITGLILSVTTTVQTDDAETVMTMTAIEVNTEKIDDSKFNMDVPEGYEIKPVEELIK